METVNTITIAEFLSLLDQPNLVNIENQITKVTQHKINDLYRDDIAPLGVKELSLAGLTRDQLLGMFERHSALIVAFGVALLKGEARIPDEQDFDPREGNQQEDDGKVEHLGLAKGFSLSYLCYLSFLISGRDDALLDFLQRRRIPKSKQFRSRLNRYYRDTVLLNPPSAG